MCYWLLKISTNKAGRRNLGGSSEAKLSLNDFLLMFRGNRKRREEENSPKQYKINLSSIKSSSQSNQHHYHRHHKWLTTIRTDGSQVKTHLEPNDRWVELAKTSFFFKKACQVPLQAKSGNILALSSLNIFFNIFFVQYSIFDDVDYDMKFLLTFPTGMTLWQHGVRHPLGQLACQPVVGHHWVLWWESITVYTTTYDWWSCYDPTLNLLCKTEYSKNIRSKTKAGCSTVWFWFTAWRAPDRGGRCLFF